MGLLSLFFDILVDGFFTLRFLLLDQENNWFVKHSFDNYLFSSKNKFFFSFNLIHNSFPPQKKGGTIRYVYWVDNGRYNPRLCNHTN